MRNLKRLRPTPAMVVALLSLSVAVSGVAWAAATIGPDDIKKNAVRKKHIKKKQVRAKHIKKKQIKSKHLKNNAVKTPKIQDLAVTTEKIADDAVTGDKADESSFGEVPNANAANEVGGVTLREIDYRGTVGDTNVTILDVGGFQLVANCNAGPTLEVFAQTDTANSVLRSYGIDTGTGTLTDTINAFLSPGPGINLVGTDEDNVIVQPIMQNTGSIVTANFMVDSDANANETDCTAIGTATQS